jgi:hypothetical protein
MWDLSDEQVTSLNVFLHQLYYVLTYPKSPPSFALRLRHNLPVRSLRETYGVVLTLLYPAFPPILT